MTAPPTSSIALTEEQRAVLAAAKGEVWMGARTAPFRTWIVYEECVVGFFHPRKEPAGRRLGAVFVLPEFRGRGIATALYRDSFPDETIVANVVDTNTASQRMMVKAGFVKWKRSPYGWLWRRPPRTTT